MLAKITEGFVDEWVVEMMGTEGWVRSHRMQIAIFQAANNS